METETQRQKHRDRKTETKRQGEIETRETKMDADRKIDMVTER